MLIIAEQSSAKLLYHVANVAWLEQGRLIFIELLEEGFEELAKAVVSTWRCRITRAHYPLNHTSHQIILEFGLAVVTFSVVEELEGLREDFFAVFIDLVSQAVGSQEVVQDHNTLLAEVRVTDWHE